MPRVEVLYKYCSTCTQSYVFCSTFLTASIQNTTLALSGEIFLWSFLRTIRKARGRRPLNLELVSCQNVVHKEGGRTEGTPLADQIRKNSS